MTARLFVLTGVSGAGKTTQLRQLRSLLPLDAFQLLNLDADGVPARADSRWRRERATVFLESAHQAARDGRSTLVEGSFLPSDFPEPQLELHFALLEADREALRRRLLERYAGADAAAGLWRVTGLTVEAFVAAVQEAQSGFIRQFEASPGGATRIDTSDRTQVEVATELLDWIQRGA